MKIWLNKQSIKRKWTYVSALTIIITYACLSIILYAGIYNWLLNDEQSTATRTANDVQAFFKSEGSNVTIQTIKENKNLINAIVDQEQTVRIFNFDYYEVMRINDTIDTLEKKPSVNDILKGTIVRSKIAGEDAYVIYQPVQIGNFRGFMEVIHPLNKFHSISNYIITLLVLLGVVAVILATLLSGMIASHLLKPIQHLRNSMIEVKDYGISQKLNLNYSAEDEIGELINIYEEMLRELKVSFDRQQQFVQDASHELRTPIQAIEGHLSLIKRWGKEDPTILNESLETSLIEVQRMKKMMEELLMLAKEDEVEQSTAVNIEKVLNDVIDDLSFIHPTAEFEMTIKGTVQLGKVKEQALYQIARNIVENGILYNDRRPFIRIDVKYTNQKTTVIIKDNGIGIPSEKIPLIFNRFYRVDESRQNLYGGTGLGLSITKMLATKHDINLTVESEVGIGTSFILEISA